MAYETDGRGDVRAFHFTVTARYRDNCEPYGEPLCKRFTDYAEGCDWARRIVAEIEADPDLEAVYTWNDAWEPQAGADDDDAPAPAPAYRSLREVRATAIEDPREIKLTLPGALYERAKDYAKAQGTSAAELIRQALADVLKRAGA